MIASKLAKTASASAAEMRKKLQAQKALLETKLNLLDRYSTPELNMQRMTRLSGHLQQKNDLQWHWELWPNKMKEYLLMQPKSQWHRLALYRFLRANDFTSEAANQIIDVEDADDELCTLDCAPITDAMCGKITKTYIIDEAEWRDVGSLNEINNQSD